MAQSRSETTRRTLRIVLKRWLLARFGQRIAAETDARLNADFLDWCGENDEWLAGVSQRERHLVRQAFLGGYVKGARAARVRW